MERTEASNTATSQPAGSAASGDNDLAWGLFVDKVAQSALLLVITKLAAAWLIAALWPVPMRSRLAWGFLPYAGLETTGQTFRSLTLWSTWVASAIAVTWLGWHYFTRRRRSPEKLWGSFLALPMAALLATLEWLRKFDADNLISGTALIYILLVLAVPTVLFFGFVESPEEQRRANPRTPISTHQPTTT